MSESYSDLCRRKFWAGMSYGTVFGPKEKAIVERRFRSECERYVAASLAELAAGMAGDADSPAERILEETQQRVKAIQFEIREEAERKPELKTQNPGTSGGCYIATVCYGSDAHSDVLLFRRFRDDTLMSSSLGRLLVALYYRVSPTLATRLRCFPRLAAAIRRHALEPIAGTLRRGKGG